MKKLYTIIIILIILSGCSNKINNENINNNEYDISIISDNKKLLFKEKHDSIELIKTIDKKEDFGFLKEEYFETKEDLYIKTTVIGKNALLSKINKKTLEIKTTDNNIEPYTFTHYKNKLYFTNVFTNKFNIFEYDENFKKIKEKTINEEGINITNDILIKDDIIYLLIGNIDKNQNVQNYIYLLDMNFNIIEKINLEYTKGSYMRFYIENNNIYITQNSNGITEKGEPNGSNLILKLDLKTKNKEFIKLNYNYPLNIYKDINNNKLIIEHYSLYVPNYIWSIYNIDTKEIKNIEFKDRPKNEDKPPFFSQTKNNYYFLFEDKIYKYNKETLKETIYELSEFNIEKPYILIHKKDD